MTSDQARARDGRPQSVHVEEVLTSTRTCGGLSVKSTDHFCSNCPDRHKTNTRDMTEPSEIRFCRIQQGAYNSGKHGNLREFVNSRKFRENSGNLKFTQGIYQMLLIVI